MGAGTAFYDATKITYSPAPQVDPQTPYVCIRIPTGGGKTIVAAHAVGVAAKEYLQTTNPMVLWLVPSTAILDQTLAALRNLNHPYRGALAAEFGRNLSVLTVAEALAFPAPTRPAARALSSARCKPSGATTPAASKSIRTRAR